MTFIELFVYCKNELDSCGIRDSISETQQITENALGVTRTQLLLRKTKKAPARAVKKVNEAIEKRRNGVPLQYILGEWDFYGETYKIGEGVLIPRPETEELCALVVERLKSMDAPVVFDLCSGSGCIGITLKKQIEKANVYLVEYYDEALAYLNQNRINLGVEDSVPAIKGDVLTGYENFDSLPIPDVIVSNPPYVERNELSTLQLEVRHEPVTALDGGEDGLDFYRAIAEKWLPFLKPGGLVAVECGETQAQSIAALFSDECENISIVRDFDGIERYVLAEKGKV